MNLVFTGLLRLLAVLGFGFISYQGFDALISELTRVVQSNWQGVAGNLMTLLNMGGFTDALGYMLAGVSTKAALTVTKKFMPKQ
ncbi:MAG: DUF2523 family protein [Methylococcales bacterium]|nr:DUF2523 family protein [Methylococcales bacterium]